MFGEGYEFRLVNSIKGKRINEDFEEEYRFLFKGKQKCQYMVRVQEFSYYFCAVKFHLARDQFKGKEKYKILTRFNDAPRVIRTCVNIMIEMYKQNPYRSFGFIGENSEKENKTNTKRFRIYKRVMENFFSPEKFFHFSDVNSSCYLLINKDNPDKDLAIHVIEMLHSLYVFEKDAS